VGMAVAKQTAAERWRRWVMEKRACAESGRGGACLQERVGRMAAGVVGMP
jgi:hypothetical protein